MCHLTKHTFACPDINALFNEVSKVGFSGEILEASVSVARTDFLLLLLSQGTVQHRGQGRVTGQWTLGDSTAGRRTAERTVAKDTVS